MDGWIDERINGCSTVSSCFTTEQSTVEASLFVKDGGASLFIKS